MRYRIRFLLQRLIQNPLAPHPKVVLDGNLEAFNQGLEILTRLTEGKVFVCVDDHTDLTSQNLPQVEYHAFSGPHPAGLPGTQYPSPRSCRCDQDCLAHCLSGCDCYWQTL